MQLINFDNIDEMTGGGDRLPAGGYVARITKVEDVPSKQYLWVEYDIAEGPYAGHFANVGDRPYLHRFSRSYKDAAQGFFKAFLLRLTESNRGRFDWQQWQQACNEQLFVGLEVGIVCQEEHYTNDKGEDKTRMVVVDVIASQDVRNGDYKLPAPVDKRKKVEAAAPADPFDDLPFRV